MTQPDGEAEWAPDTAALAQPRPEASLAERTAGNVVATSMRFTASLEAAWETIMFYEQIDERPPLYLRWLLPTPLGTEGRKTEVGDEARCLYRGGHLIKRVTEVEAPRRYVFEVSEQQLTVGGGMRLSGGDYQLSPAPDGATEVRLTTRYTSPLRPRWLFARIEALICHLFHRHILGAMRRVAASK